LYDHSGYVTSIDAFPTSLKFASSSADKTVKVRDLSKLETRSQSDKHLLAVTDLAYDRSNKQIISSSSNARRYYCPENVSSSIQWRVFLANVLSKCCIDDSLIDFQQNWTTWGRNFRDSIVGILQSAANQFDTISLPENIRATLGYMAPRGQGSHSVAGCLVILPDEERKKEN
jgi:WD40 repeat protein